jgi:hypothetical protein
MSDPKTRAAAPRSRGRLSQWTIERLWNRTTKPAPSVPSSTDAFGEDLQLALFLAYEPHFREIGRADEWDPVLLGFRARLEAAYERELIRRVGAPGRRPVDVRTEIPALIAADDSPSVSAYMEEHGTVDQMRQFVLHRSAYQLKEGDGHTFGIPRLRGRSKQILAAIQAGEYGADETDREIHSDLFAATMRGLGLDDRPGAYLDFQPASALGVSNLISLFGLHRRWRAALVGHLAVFEMTSVTPMGRYSRALERLGQDERTRRFYDVHILADAEHEHMALAMAAELAADEPALAGDILFGARAAIETDRVFAEGLMATWQAFALVA